MQYADEYTTKEKIIRLTSYIGLSGLGLIAAKQWFFPLVEDYAARPHCYTFLGYNGADIIWHWLFIVMPISLFLIIAITMLPHGIKSLKQGQFPPIGTKVYKPTAISTGIKAKLLASRFIIVPLFMLAFSIWGILQLDQMPEIDKQKLDPAACVTQ